MIEHQNLPIQPESVVRNQYTPRVQHPSRENHRKAQTTQENENAGLLKKNVRTRTASSSMCHYGMANRWPSSVYSSFEKRNFAQQTLELLS